MPLADSEVADAVLEEARPAAAVHLADLEHPWLGLESFREETRAYFFGRDTEIAELHLRLRSHPLLVLYGRSGLGKTSILRAGLIPRLTAEDHRPALHRFDYSNERFGPAGQLLFLLFNSRQDNDEWSYESALARARQWALELREELALDLPADEAASWLWLRLHWRKQPPAISHLILDQFEEVFTLGVQKPGADYELRDSLAILLQGAIPEPISHLIAEHDSLLDHFDPDSVPVRVILALRDDYVYALNRWRRHLPALGQNNFELHALRGPAAFDAVFKPGELRCHYRETISEQNKVDTGLPPVVSKEVAERIVHFVAKKGERVPLEEIEAVPPILSLLCRELNERRFSEPNGTPERPALQISFSEDDADVETIIKTFYERCLKDRPEAVRIFIEEDLVSKSGARLAQDEKSILACFENGSEIPGAPDDRRAAGYGDSAKAREGLKELVDQRLLTSIGGGDNPRYELIHDLLAAVAEKSRTAREGRLAAERTEWRAAAEAKEANDRAAIAEAARIDEERRRQEAEVLRAESEAARQTAEHAQRRARRLALIAALVALAAVGTLIAALFAQREAERQRGLAKEAELAAVTQTIEAGRHRTDAENARRRSDALVSLVTIVERDLSRGLESIGKADLLAEFKKQLAEYRARFADATPQTGTIDKRLKEIRDRGEKLEDAGDTAAALQVYLQGLDLARDEAAPDPRMKFWVVRFLCDQGDMLMVQGITSEASRRYQEALTLAQSLTVNDSDDVDLQRELSICHIKVGNVQREQGDLANALTSYRASLAITEKFSKQDPGNALWQRERAVSYEKIGDVQSGRGDPAGALMNYRDSLAIVDKLAKQEPANPNWQRALSELYRKIGDVQWQSDLADALKNYRDSLAIAEKLAKQDPGNVVLQRELSVCYNKVGNVQRAQNDLVGALKNYRDALAVFEKLSKQDLGNAMWQHDLSVSYDSVGSVQRAQGDVVGALNSFRDSLAIRERLSSRDPGNATWQGHLAWSYWKVGLFLKDEGESNKEARTMMEKGRDILRQVKTRTGLTAVQQQWLDSIEADLRK